MTFELQRFLRTLRNITDQAAPPLAVPNRYQIPFLPMITETLVELEVGCRSMIWFPEIAPRLKEPHRFIPVRVEHQFPNGRKSAQFDYYNDSNGLFGIRYSDRTPRFLSLEAEHTSQVDCSNLSKTSFLKKFLAIRYIMDNRLYQTVWGLPNLMTPVVTSSQARINT